MCVFIYLFMFWAAYLQIHMYPQWGFLAFFSTHTHAHTHTHLQQQPTICNMASRFYKQIPPQGGDTAKTTPGPLTPGSSPHSHVIAAEMGKWTALFIIFYFFSDGDTRGKSGD